MEIKEAVEVLKSNIDWYHSDPKQQEAKRVIIAWHEERERKAFVCCDNCLHSDPDKFKSECFGCGLATSLVNFKPKSTTETVKPQTPITIKQFEVPAYDGLIELTTKLQTLRMEAHELSMVEDVPAKTAFAHGLYIAYTNILNKVDEITGNSKLKEGKPNIIESK